MQTLDPQHKQYILEHEQLIRKNKWKEFFSNRDCPKGIGFPLYNAGVPFMLEMACVPSHCFRASRIESAIIPHNVTDIKEYAFAYCTSLISITIPDSVNRIASSAFSGCKGIKSITVPDSVTSVARCAFADCISLESINIPTSVTSIEGSTFSGCSSLENINIPKNVVSIGDFAFSRCKALTSIIIPVSVTSIGDYAFSDIPTALTISYNGTKEQWKKIYNKYAFTNTYFTVNCTDGKLIKKRKK